MDSAVSPPVSCPNCGAFFPVSSEELAALQQCPSCERPTQVILFPAYDRPVTTGTSAEKVVTDGEATCFFHPQHRALVPCDKCGRFLCALCDLNLQGRHLCPSCLEAATKKGKLPSLERKRTRWDQIVPLILFGPILFCYILLPVTSFAALSLIIWKWKAPGSLVANTRLRLWVYATIAVLEFGGSSFMWWMMFSHRR